MAMKKPPKSASSKKSVIDFATVRLNAVDGTRQRIGSTVRVSLLVRDGDQNVEINNKQYPADQLPELTLQSFGNARDRYAILLTANNYIGAGFFPVWAKSGAVSIVSLMLLPNKHHLAFATWQQLKSQFPHVCMFLSCDCDDATARQRYEKLLTNNEPALASLLNLITAMSDIHLAQGTPLDYFEEILWDESLGQDRFFGFCRLELIDQIVIAKDKGLFEPEPAPGLFHRGATRSFKQKRFGEANVQLTFHEGVTKKGKSGATLVKVEPDIDYFSDPAAHTLMEVFPNQISHQKTDPRQVYVLRWIAGQQAGMPEFDPPYTIKANT
jgi:hypothetical protein